MLSWQRVLARPGGNKKARPILGTGFSLVVPPKFGLFGKHKTLRECAGFGLPASLVGVPGFDPNDPPPDNGSGSGKGYSFRFRPATPRSIPRLRRRRFSTFTPAL
jgi:hypothetical protein